MLVAAERTPSGLGPDSFAAHAQQEVDFRFESGPWYFRFDFDTQFASNDSILPLGGYWRSPPWSEPAEKVKVGPPEWAMLQYSMDQWRFRGGIVTEMIGLEDWDPWVNIFPTRGINYNVTPGRTLGLEVSYILESGHELFIFGGCDVDWADCFAHDLDDDGVDDIEALDGMKAGIGVTTIQEFYSTFSGIAAYPAIDFYLADLTGEIYAHENLTVGYEAAGVLAGVADEQDKTTYYGALLGGVTLNILPSEPLHPMVRAHGTYDPTHNALNFYPAYNGLLPDFAASAGVSAKPYDSLKISLEGKAQHFDVGWIPGIYAGVSFVPFAEPAPYTAKFEEEPAAPEPAAQARGERRAPAPSALPAGVGIGRSLAARGR